MPYVGALLAVNDLHPDLFVEPFAGGASVSLELLATGKVERIGLGERDSYLVAFWQTVFYDTDWLCEQVAEIKVTLATWERMKTTSFDNRRDRALACLFLNRTSFNGTLHDRTGPLGGKAQTSAYKLDCRFPRERLVGRIRLCASLADRVEFVRDSDALELIRYTRRRLKQRSVFFYLDPPFWKKASHLYRLSFSSDQHERLASALRYVREPYLLSYDPAPEVERLYARHGCATERVELRYATQRTAETELVITNLKRLPQDTRLWRTHGEWTQLRRRRSPIRTMR